MKKIICFILIAVCFSLLVGCTPMIKEYTGIPLKTLTFITVDYNGGYTRESTLNFENNTVSERDYLPGDGDEPEFTVVASFTETQEKTLINKLYSYGLFDIKENYKSPAGIVDGGGWRLTIEYSDGSVKKSSGSNNSPAVVFSNCAKAFYDVCSMGIVASVPSEYYRPPNLSYSFRSAENGSMGYLDYGVMADYKWNGFGSSGNDIYELNQSNDLQQKFDIDREYILVLYTANYGDYEKFQKCTVTSYDNDVSLANKTVVYSKRWFKQEEISLELNKIYVVRLDFKNGDFVEYTFNTNVAFY